MTTRLIPFGSENPSISSDGRYVAFESGEDILPGIHGAQVYVRDRTAGTTDCVSVDDMGTPGDGISRRAAISGDGRYVVFESYATNLVAEVDFDQLLGAFKTHVYVRDRVLGATTRVSVDSGGQYASSDANKGAISADGRYVAFASAASNLVPGDTNDLSDVFVHDRVTGLTTRVSVDDLGSEGNGDSSRPALSGDGQLVAFISEATNLVSADTNNMADVFVHDLSTQTTTLASVDGAGAQGSNQSLEAAISGDGRYVVFARAFDGVFLRDRTAGTTTNLSVNEDGSPVSHSDAGYAVFKDENRPAISANGIYVAFSSFLGDFVIDDGNQLSDVFVTLQCGDGALWFPESCDDQNSAGGDGCNSACRVEECYSCSGEPSACSPEPDGVDCNDGDPCTSATCSSGQCLGPDTLCLPVLCPGTPDPCVVSGTVSLPAGAEVDLGGRALRVAQSSKITTTEAGSFSLLDAASVTLEAKSTLEAPAGGNIELQSSGPCVVEGTVRSNTSSGDGGEQTVRMTCNGITLAAGSNWSRAASSEACSTWTPAPGCSSANRARRSISGAAKGGRVGSSRCAAPTSAGWGHRSRPRPRRFEPTRTVSSSMSTRARVAMWTSSGGGDLNLLDGAKFLISVNQDVRASSVRLVSLAGDLSMGRRVTLISSGLDRGDIALLMQAPGACTLDGRLSMRSNVHNRHSPWPSTAAPLLWGRHSSSKATVPAAPRRASPRRRSAPAACRVRSRVARSWMASRAPAGTCP